jgi:hypothetical protein
MNPTSRSWIAAERQDAGELQQRRCRCLGAVERKSLDLRRLVVAEDVVRVERR